MSVSISLLAGAGWQFFDNNGIPLAGGLLYTYAAGTTTPQETYTTSVGNIANANPIVLDSAGRTPNEIWLTSTLTYKFLLKTSVGTQIASYDDIGGAFDSASLAASSGASLIGYIQGGAGSVAETVQAKLREVVSVKDFGADSTGVSSSVSAFNAALLIGGTIYVPSGTYNLDGKVSLTVNNTTLWLAANVTLNLSGVPATQVPFGNQIHVIATNCAVIGSGPSSLLQITGGSQANAVGILHKAPGFTIRDLTIDGDKANGTAISDDTFMSGISILCGTYGGATTDVQATVDNCVIKNFLQYGVNVYGDQANGVKIVNCNIRDIGKAGDALSVGGGIAVTRGVSDFIASNNVIKNCKLDGMFMSSAGLDCGNWTITGNVCHQNGGSGITFKESSDYSSESNIGLFNVAVTGNTCTGNTRSGIQLDVNTVGYLKYFSITGNTCEGNTYGGIEVGSTNTTPNIVSKIQISGNLVLDNGTVQIGIGQYVETVQGVPQSFTPVIKGSTTAGVGTYSTQSGLYTYSNGIVYFELVLEWSAHTGSGDILIAGFPYAGKNAEPQSTSWVFANGLTITGQGVFGLTLNATQGPLGAINNGSYSTVALDTAALLRITGFYFTN